MILKNISYKELSINNDPTNISTDDDRDLVLDCSIMKIFLENKIFNHIEDENVFELEN